MFHLSLGLRCTNQRGIFGAKHEGDTSHVDQCVCGYSFSKSFSCWWCMKRFAIIVPKIWGAIIWRIFVGRTRTLLPCVVVRVCPCIAGLRSSWQDLKFWTNFKDGSEPVGKPGRAGPPQVHENSSIICSVEQRCRRNLSVKKAPSPVDCEN